MTPTTHFSGVGHFVALALACVLALLATSFFCALFFSKARLISRFLYAQCATVCGLLLILAATKLALAPGVASSSILSIGLPELGAAFRMDGLSAFFMIVVNLSGMLASLYAIGYGAHENEPGRVLPFYPAFLAGMNLTLLAADAYAFLFSWECMSVFSGALVIAHHRTTENLRAGFVYIVMASFGGLALFFAFGLMASGPHGLVPGSLAFDTIRDSVRPHWVAGAAFCLALIGAGSKAGLAPLHVWLPLAHPAAPSHASALMSGAMTKVAIYAFIRIAFDLLGVGMNTTDVWQGALTMAIGAATAVLGVLFATIESDFKRLLAYSTIENIGIIFAALGLALVFKANDMGLFAALALSAGLLHALNHSLFKGLLFFGAGAVLSATGLRNIERMGGLIHAMPKTSFAFLGGCVAIAALPPLNGFASEWLIFQAVLMSPGLPQWGLKLLSPAVGVALALSAALCAGVFVRLFGVAFLGRTRSAEASQAAETDRWSLAAMFLSLGCCLLAGILPGFLMDFLAPVTQTLVGARLPAQSALPWLTIAPIAETRASYNGLLVFCFIALSTVFAVQIIHRFGSRLARRTPAWDCGFPDTNPTAQYTANSFAQPVRRVFNNIVFRARESVDMPQPGDLRPAKIRLSLQDFLWSGLYAPVLAAVGWLADLVNKTQTMTIRGYLSLVFAALIALLMMVAAWR